MFIAVLWPIVQDDLLDRIDAETFKITDELVVQPGKMDVLELGEVPKFPDITLANPEIPYGSQSQGALD